MLPDMRNIGTHVAVTWSIHYFRLNCLGPPDISGHRRGIGMEHYINLATKAMFVENILLAYFLGMCSFLAISKKIDTSIGLGFAVVFVLTITAPANWAIHNYFLQDGALAWAGFPDVDLSFLEFYCIYCRHRCHRSISGNDPG